jgi:hypothetical protein
MSLNFPFLEITIMYNLLPRKRQKLLTKTKLQHQFSV